MSPVSFQLVGGGEDRVELMAQARALTEAGIRVFEVDPERGLLIRSEHVARAEVVLRNRLDRTTGVEERDESQT